MSELVLQHSQHLAEVLTSPFNDEDQKKQEQGEGDSLHARERKGPVPRAQALQRALGSGM